MNQASESNRHQLLALSNALVSTISNLHFGPEVGVGKPKADVSAVQAWLAEIQKMSKDLTAIQNVSKTRAEVILGDARKVEDLIPANSIDAVITSPPYPNEKDYTRITRLRVR